VNEFINGSINQSNELTFQSSLSLLERQKVFPSQHDVKRGCVKKGRTFLQLTVCEKEVYKEGQKDSHSQYDVKIECMKKGRKYRTVAKFPFSKIISPFLYPNTM